MSDQEGRSPARSDSDGGKDREPSASPRGRDRSASPRRDRSVSPRRDRSASPRRKRSTSRDRGGRKDRSRSRSRSRDRRRSRSPRRDRSRSRDRYRRSRSRSRDRRYRSRSRSRSPYRGSIPLRREPPRPGCQVFVAGFNFMSSERDVERQFAKYGRVTEVRIVRDATGRSRGFGFVAYDNEDDVRECIRKMHGRDWEGRRLQVEICRNPKCAPA